MNKYEFIDEGDFWGIAKNGHVVDGSLVVDDIKALQAQLDAANAHIAELRNAIAGPAAYLRANKLSTIGTDSIYHQIMNEALDAVPVQSLNDIRASAVINAGWTLFQYEEISHDTCMVIEDFANKLKDTK